MAYNLDDILKETDPCLAFLRLEEFYRLSDVFMQAVIRSEWDFGRDWIIPGLDYSDWDQVIFAPLIGEDKYGLNAEARVEARLSYHAIENARADFRENTMDVYLCYHAALAAGLNVAQLLEEAASVSEAWMAGLFRGLLKRKPEERSLYRMGFRQIPLDNGIAFQWIGAEKDYNNLEPKHLDNWGREVIIDASYHQ